MVAGCCLLNSGAANALTQIPCHILSAPQVKTLTACIASGIGDAWEVAEALNAWEGFWAPSPSPQQLRAAAYVLRMLCYAECPTRPGGGGGGGNTAAGGGECAGCLGNCNEARLKAIVVSVVVQVSAGGRTFVCGMHTAVVGNGGMASGGVCAVLTPSQWPSVILNMLECCWG